MITCAANGCPSSQTTKIDGKPISFFPFPEDDLRKNQWLHNCNLASGVNDKEPMHLCEVHFERINFTASRDLKPSAVPTLFGRIEEPPRKRKAESVLQAVPIKVSSYKQKKLEELSHTIVTPPGSPFMQLRDNAEDSVNANRMDISVNNGIAMNGSIASSSVGENCEMNTKLYRLTIQIDKIRGKPGPRCKKLVPLILFNNDTKDSVINEHGIMLETQSVQKPVQKICAKGSCKLRKCIYNSKAAFQCKLCGKYYIAKRKENQDDKSNSSSIYPMTFSNVQSLNAQITKYFICDICQTECNTQMRYDKHVRLHVSTDPSYPYKCHQCAQTFELKEGIKQHYSVEHPKLKVQNTVLQVTPSTVNTKVVSQQNDYLCTNCNITFSNDQAYRNHINSHKKKEGLRCNISETNNIFPVPNPLTGSQIGILQPVKFSCNVCSKEFDNVGEVDVHTRTHLEDADEDHKCNICKKSFKSSVDFGEHLKHHLSRAHPCPICSKAFINRTTLKIHLKTHGES